MISQTVQKRNINKQEADVTMQSSLAQVMANGSDDEKQKYQQVKKEDLIKLDFYQKGGNNNA